MPVAFLPVRKFFPNRINLFNLKKFVRSVLRKFADYLVIGVLQASILESSASPELNIFSKGNALMVNQPSALFQNLFPVAVECGYLDFGNFTIYRFTEFSQTADASVKKVGENPDGNTKNKTADGSANIPDNWRYFIHSIVAGIFAAFGFGVGWKWYANRNRK